jgi:hypothetical protein
LPPAAKAAWLVAQGKYAAAADLGDAALPAFWVLLDSSWATAEAAGSGFGSALGVGDLVRKRLPVVRALASIQSPAAGALSLVLVGRLPPTRSADDRDGFIVSRDGYSLSAMTLHPAVEEGQQLVVLLDHLKITRPRDASEALKKLVDDHRPRVKQAAIEALAAQ